MDFEGNGVWNLPGHVWQILVRHDAPSAKMCCAMVARVRMKLQWSRKMMSAFLGVLPVTLRKWEAGKRNPNAAARRLIWIVCTLAESPESLKTGLDFANWGKTQEWINFGNFLASLPAQEQPSGDPEPCKPAPVPKVSPGSPGHQPASP